MLEREGTHLAVWTSVRGGPSSELEAEDDMGREDVVGIETMLWSCWGNEWGLSKSVGPSAPSSEEGVVVGPGGQSKASIARGSLPYTSSSPARAREGERGD